MNSEIKSAQGFPGHVVSVTGASKIADLWTVQILDPAAEHHAFAWRTFEANLSLDYALKRENNFIIRITEDGA